MTMTVFGVILVIVVAYVLGRVCGKSDAREEYQGQVRELHTSYLEKCNGLGEENKTLRWRVKTLEGRGQVNPKPE